MFSSSEPGILTSSIRGWGMRHNAAWKAFLFFLCFDIATSAASESVRLYVDNSEGDDVSVIDLKTLDTVNDIRLADKVHGLAIQKDGCLLYTSPSPRDRQKS